MSNNDTRQFIQDALLRYDPEVDLSEGSRADQELVQPILQRIGLDPFDDDILTFVRTRVQQAFPNLAITEADELTDTTLDPMRVLIEPLVREIKLVKLRSSLRNANSLSDDEVDSLMGNFFIGRITGGFSVGVVRILFSTPQSLSLSLTNAATTRGGLRFMPTRPQAITADQMLLNRLGSEYYFDVNYTAENRGDQYNVEPGEIVSVANLPTAVRITNPRRFRGGTPRETSIDFIARGERSLSDKTLTVERGIIATLTESFPAIRRIFEVGFRDPEMQRDVIKGGSLGPVPSADISGNFFGTGTAVDDLDGDLTTPILDAPGGAFVSRLGSAGAEPDGWFVTIVYTNGVTLVVQDVAVLEVLSATQVRIEHDLPVTAPATSITWMLRQRSLTLSDIPGGIVLPDTAAGTLEIKRDEVHIGGKTDVYIAGETELATAQIESLTDESPAAKGTNAQTQGLTPGSEDIVLLNDPSGLTLAGSSLVLEEGVDAGSYRILEIVSGPSPLALRVDTEMTGAQGSLAWKVVDEIDVELTDPKDVKVDGADMVTAAGNQIVTTASATNFIDANVQEGDVLELFDEDFGGEFVVDEVNAVSLKVSPAPARTFTAVSYRVFRRSEAVDPPLVRVSSLELLDSTGAPSGTVVPYRDPILALSNAFQNEGSGFVFEGLCIVGLVSLGVSAGSAAFAVGGLTIDWEVYNPDTIWQDPVNVGTFSFLAGPAKTAAQVVAEINADFLLDLMGVKALVITKLNKDYVGIVSALHVRFVAGSALSAFNWDPGVRNSLMRSVEDQFSDAGVRPGDAIEVVEGNSAGILGRVIAGPLVGGPEDLVLVGTGPVGPEDMAGLITGLFNNVVFNPDVNVLVRIGRASVGSARVFFLNPTSAEFDYRSTRFTASVPEATLIFRPDPENLRMIRPAPPLTELPNTGTTANATPDTLTDTSASFLLFGIQPGDLVDILYVPIIGTAPLPPSGNIAFTGSNNTLRVRLDTDPFITISFPFPMPRQDVVDFINEQVGEDIASLTGGGNLQLRSSRRIELDPTSTVITHASNPLFLAGAALNSDHPDKGTYIVRTVAENVLTFSTMTSQQITSGTTPNTLYRIRRYVQRISPTEMNLNLDSSGLYYADVEMISMAPGNVYNIPSGVTLETMGVRSDGYRLLVDNPVTSFSRAEVLRAEISRTMLLVGSADDPVEAVQLSQQNVQVTYERSQIVDEVQSFADSDFQRVVCEEILVRHLFPHYVSMTWNYAGGSGEPDMLRAVQELLDKVEPDEQLEVTDLTDVLRRRGASSVFTPDASSSTGRVAPFFIVVYHDENRVIHALIVKDYVTTVRTQRYIPDKITLTRITTGGIR
jgi:hypothetical protein